MPLETESRGLPHDRWALCAARTQHARFKLENGVVPKFKSQTGRGQGGDRLDGG